MAPVSPEPAASVSSGRDLVSDSSNGSNGPTTKGPLGFLDANVYATKKTIAQGMLDVALLTANASQLKYLLQIGSEHEFYYLMMTLISLSIVLQILIGVVIVLKSRYNINNESHGPKAEFLNNLIVWLVFGVTVMNVFVAAFGMEPPKLPIRYYGMLATTNQTPTIAPE